MVNPHCKVPLGEVSYGLQEVVSGRDPNVGLRVSVADFEFSIKNGSGESLNQALLSSRSKSVKRMSLNWRERCVRLLAVSRLTFWIRPERHSSTGGHKRYALERLDGE